MIHQNLKRENRENLVLVIKFQKNVLLHAERAQNHVGYNINENLILFNKSIPAIPRYLFCIIFDYIVLIFFLPSQMRNRNYIFLSINYLRYCFEFYS